MLLSLSLQSSSIIWWELYYKYEISFSTNEGTVTHKEAVANFRRYYPYDHCVVIASSKPVTQALSVLYYIMNVITENSDASDSKVPKIAIS